MQAGAAAIGQYVTLLRNEVQRMMVVNGCTYENLDWRHDFYKRYYGAYTYYGDVMGAPVIPKAGCAIFTAYGGPIAPQVFDKYALPAYVTGMPTIDTSKFIAGHASIRWVSRLNEGTPQSDVAIMFAGMDPALCSYLMYGNLTTATPVDQYLTAANPNSAPPAIMSASTDLIDLPDNLTGDYFANRLTMSNVTWCDLGAIILPR